MYYRVNTINCDKLPERHVRVSEYEESQTDDTVTPKRQHTAPEYLERRRQRRKSSTLLGKTSPWVLFSYVVACCVPLY